jgi:hypothetical protein
MATAVQIGNPEVSEAQRNSEVGEAQRLFAEQAAAGARELVESGQCKPYTIVNFNPVEVGLQGELKRYKVWTPDDGRLPEGVFRIELPYGDKLHRGHVLTIREPHKYGKMTGATGAGSPGEVIAQREPKYLVPQAIAYTFMEHFSPIFTAKAGTVLPPAPKDARKIYGLLVFEGDLRLLEAMLEETDPARRVIRVPVAHVTTIGKTSIKSYRTVEFPLDEYLERMFTGQRKFADATVARAQQKWSETETIADISDSDRIWYRWMIDKGYAKKPAPGEKTWLNEYLVLTGDEGKVAANLRKCQACKAVEPEPMTPFCPKCAAPINTFQTFMAGFPVADAWLMSLKGEEREVALAEMQIRRQGFGAAEASPAARGPYKGKGKGKAAEAVDPAEEVEPAVSTALPGEE